MSTRSSRRAKRAAQNQTPNAAPNTAASNDALKKSSNVSSPNVSSSVARKTAAPNAVAPKSSTRSSLQNAPTTRDQTTTANFEVSPRNWQLLAGAILFFAFCLRFWNLDLVPFHHDEGVNGDFLNKLFNQGEYKYNPENFHGPTLYYFALFTSYLNTFFLGKPGFNEIALRMIPAAFGVGVIALVLSLRRHLGTVATLCAALLLAFSPGMVYISRYFIHEMQFVFFTLLAVIAVLRFRPQGAWFWPALVGLLVAGVFASQRVGDWLRLQKVESLTVVKLQFLLLTLGIGAALLLSRPLGRKNWIFVASASLALLFGSKETAPVSVVVLLIAGALTWLLCDKLQSKKFGSSTRFSSSTRSETESAERSFAFLAALVVGALLLFWAITVVFYSSFSRDYVGDGMTKFFAAYDKWHQTGVSDFQAKPLLTYLVWMLTIEPTIFVLGFAGVLVALWQRRSRFQVFVALWACGIFAAYSLIPYKTPWLMLNFVLPLGLMSGLALQTAGNWLARKSSTRSAPRWIMATVLSPFLLLTIVQMCRLNFVDYDNDDTVRDSKGEIIPLPKWQTTRNGLPVDLLPGDIKKYPYIYVHTQRGYLELMRQIDKYAQRSGLGDKMKIMVTSDEYWPMPWSLRNYPVGYYGRVTNPTDETVVIGCVNDDPKYGQDAQLQQLLGDRYVRVGEYPLRPSVLFSLWVRRDLAE